LVTPARTQLEEYVIEFESSGGNKLRIHRKSAAPPDWANLLRAWRRKQVHTGWLMVEFQHRGREISQKDILDIRALIERHPKESRRTLSTKLCEAWQWRQTNGALRDMVCRSMLLMLDRAGQIILPPVSYVRHNPLAHRARPEPARIDATPIEDRLRNLQLLEFEQVRRTSHEPLFNS
jgi:hypothetical protein